MRRASVPELGPYAWFTTADVARALHVTTEGVRWLVRAERLRCLRTPSGRRLFEKVEVLRLAEARAAARLKGVHVLRAKRRQAPGEPRQLSLFRPVLAAATVERLDKGQVQHAECGAKRRGSDNARNVA